MGMIITIDGPAGAGKSTVARALADKLGFHYINTGDLYRFITYCAILDNLNVNSAQLMDRLSLKIVEKYIQENSDIDLLSHINSISEKLHSPEVDKKVSFVARHSSVRKNLIPLQRLLVKDGSVVMEGRDIGTIIVPYANVKFFITADEYTRIMRRYRELQEKGYQITFSEVKKEILCRDYIDSRRETAPLAQPEDAIFIDTSHQTVSEVVEEMLEIVRGLKDF